MSRVNNNPKLLATFEGFKIRRLYDEKLEKWYFSIVDVVALLTESTVPRRYWSDLKIKLQQEGSEAYEKIVQLKIKAEDGKYRGTDMADVETLLRLVQSIPSSRAEPFKLWLAKVGYERLQEMADPEKALNRSRDYWQKMGRSQKWIQQRMMSQEVRNKLTDYWKNHDVAEPKYFALLTNIIHQEWSDVSIQDHKKLKGLKSQNLRDHMTDAELVFTALAELSTRQIAETIQARGFKENTLPAKKGGRIARNARLELEQKTGKKVVSGKNFLPSRKNLTTGSC